MRVKQIKGYDGRAPNLSKKGNVEFKLWVDGKGELYVQLEKSDKGGTATKRMLFSASEHAKRMATMPQKLPFPKNKRRPESRRLV